MKKSFTGTSTGGDLTEAIRDALKKAATEFNTKSPWKIQETSGKELSLGPISVKIEVDGAEGGGPGPGDVH
jgi:hypothetical protein